MFLITLLFLLSHDFITLLFFFNIFYFYKYYSKPQAQELSKTDEYFEETYLRILGLLNWKLITFFFVVSVFFGAIKLILYYLVNLRSNEYLIFQLFDMLYFFSIYLTISTFYASLLINSYNNFKKNSISYYFCMLLYWYGYALCIFIIFFNISKFISLIFKIFS